MARFARLEVYNSLLKIKVVPLFYHSDINVCKSVMKACYNGGLKIFEFTNRGDNAHEIFNELNKTAKQEMPDLVLGIGSIVDPATAALYIQLGAAFIVTPLLNEDVAKICNRRKIAWIPGCATASEISKAEESGAEFVKLFPADQLGGPAFVKSIKAPMPWTSLMASGGVTPDPENLKAWFNAGASCVGMGGQLVTKDIISSGNYEKLTEVCKNIVKTIESL